MMNTQNVGASCALLLGARYLTPLQEGDNRIIQVELGIATRRRAFVDSRGSYLSEPFEQFFSFFKRSVCEAAPERTPPFIRVTLKCTENTEQDGRYMMRVAPFVNGKELETLLIPKMSDFLKISSVRGVAGGAYDHPAIQVVDRALELLYLRVFSCDFNPEELPPPADPRLQLPGQRYTFYSFDSGAKDERSSHQRADGVGAPQCANDNHLYSAGDCSARKQASGQCMTLTGGQTRQQEPEHQSMPSGLPHAPVAKTGLSSMHVEPQHHAARTPDVRVQSEPSYARVRQPQRSGEYSEQREGASARGLRNFTVPPFIIRKTLGNQNNRSSFTGMPQHGEQPQQRWCHSRSRSTLPGHKKESAAEERR